MVTNGGAEGEPSVPEHRGKGSFCQERGPFQTPSSLRSTLSITSMVHVILRAAPEEEERQDRG